MGKRRKEMRNKMKINKEELENRREKEETRKIIEELLEKLRGKERKERVKKIKESRYNEWFKKIMTDEVLVYLRKEKRKEI